MTRKICQICQKIYNEYDATSYNYYCPKCQNEIEEQNNDEEDKFEDYY